MVDGIYFQRLKWFAPDATVESIVISANSAPLAKARRRSCGISTTLLRDQISVKGSPPFACHQRVNRCGRAVFLTPSLDPRPRGLLIPLQPGALRSATMR